MRPGYIPGLVMVSPEPPRENVSGAWLNDGCDGPRHTAPRWSRTSVFIRTNPWGHIRNQYPISRPDSDRRRGSGSATGEPEPDLAFGRLRGVRAVHEVELGLRSEITPDAARNGLLTGPFRPRAAGMRRPRGALQDRRHHGAGRDEFQERVEERLAVVLGVVRPGQRVVDVLELEGGDAQALRSIRPMISPIIRRSTPSGLISTSVRSVIWRRSSSLLRGASSPARSRRTAYPSVGRRLLAGQQAPALPAKDLAAQ